MKKKRWFYHLPGQPYAYGPSEFDEPVDEAEVRRMILRSWYPGRKRLPNGVEVWPGQY